MARLRYNGLATGSAGSLADLTLSGSHTNSTTTLTFNAALTHSNGTAVPTLSGSDFFMLSILDSGGRVVEVVKVTAYTTAGTTATVVRGQEGTSGVAHASGAKVVHGTLASGVGDTRTAYKTADETVTSSTTLQDDDHLVVPIGANETWAVQYTLYLSSANATGDFKATIGVPSGATVRNTSIIGIDAAATSATGSAKMQSISSATALNVGVPASAQADTVAIFTASIENGATPGNVILQWAQNVSNASGTVVEQGSWLLATRLA